MVSNLCPSGAIDPESGSIDIGRCVFCRECSFACPEKIVFTDDYRIAANTRNGLIIHPGNEEHLRLNEEIIRTEVRRMFKR